MPSTNFKAIYDEVLNDILPSPEETERALNLFKVVSSYLEPILKDLNYPYRISLEGSVSKGTHLKNDTDLDVFILIRYEGINRKWLEVLVDRIYEALQRFKPKKLYASHPYIRFKEGGIEVDVVPAYMAYNINEVKTAVDRTVFHTQFVKSKLSKDMLNEVRLLKKFFKGIEVYGAEIKTEGFSGYLTELLIIHYGSFIDAIKGIADWRLPQVIDILKTYEDLRNYLRVYGWKPLIFPDPVDVKRNAAAALSVKSFSTAVLASKTFLEKPSTKYFYPKVAVDPWDKVERMVSSRKTAIVGYLVVYEEGISPDVIWGELKRCLRRGRSVLKQFEFEVVDSSVWCDEVSRAVLIYEVIPYELPPYTLHLGPKPFKAEGVSRFLSKYLRSENVIGPWIDEAGDLIVMKLRRYLTPYEVLLGEAKNILQVKHVRSYEVLRSDILRDLYSSSEEFRSWLYKFIIKRPLWLNRTT